MAPATPGRGQPIDELALAADKESRGPRLSNPKEQEIATLRAWSESAPYWDKHAPVIRAMFEPLSDALIWTSTYGDSGGTYRPTKWQLDASSAAAIR